MKESEMKVLLCKT